MRGLVGLWQRWLDESSLDAEYRRLCRQEFRRQNRTRKRQLRLIEQRLQRQLIIEPF